MDFDVDLPDLTCPDLFLISVERVTYVVCKLDQQYFSCDKFEANIEPN